MKVKLIKNEQGKSIGWDMTAETEEEKLVVNTIRNLQFFGYDDTAIEYSGRVGGVEGTDAGTLSWKQSQYISH